MEGNEEVVTRRRGSSFHEERDNMRELGGEGGEGESSSSSNQVDVIQPSSSSSEPSNVENSSGGAARVNERSTQLNTREVKALKMGLEQATTKNKTQQKEEEEEKRAAELEKKKRASITSPNSMGVDTPLKRYKLLLLGDSGVGKSSLICRWTLDQFNASLLGTVGVDFKAKKVSIGSDNYHIQVWDTAGQEQFHRITTSYYKGANGIMLVYDVTDAKSASEVSYWMKNIKSHAADDVAVVMVGNKVDLLGETNDTSILTTGKNSAKKYDVSHHMASAKDSTGVEDAFINLVKLIVNSDSSSSSACPGGSHLPPNPGAQPAHKLNPSVVEKSSSSSITSIFRGKKKTKEISSSSGADSQGNIGDGDQKGGEANGKNGKEKCVIS